MARLFCFAELSMSFLCFWQLVPKASQVESTENFSSNLHLNFVGVHMIIKTGYTNCSIQKFSEFIQAFKRAIEAIVAMFLTCLSLRMSITRFYHEIVYALLKFVFYHLQYNYVQQNALINPRISTVIKKS